jgi:hypothetical protein
MTTSLPIEFLEQRAAEQRRQLHNSAQELRSAVRERVDVKRNVREYIAPLAGAAAVLGLALGYGIAGVFVGDRCVK